MNFNSTKRFQRESFANEALESGLLFELRFNKMIPKRAFSVVKSRKSALPAASGKLLEIMGI